MIHKRRGVYSFCLQFNTCVCVCVCKTLALKFSKVYMLLTFENGIMEFCLMVEASDHVYVLHVSIPVVMTSRI